MLQARVIPCLLLKEGSLVKTVKFKKPAYIGDPINAVRIYNECYVDELIVLDIYASFRNHDPDISIIREIASECFMPVTYGGGIKNLEHIKNILNIGIEKVAINSYTLENWEFMHQAARTFGSQSIVASIDLKKDLVGRYRVFSHLQKKTIGHDPVQWAQKLVKLGAGEILLTNVDRDGTWIGYDIDMVKMVTSAVDVPVIASGGAGCMTDIHDVVKCGGASAAALGSMVFYQKKNLGVLINFPPRHIIEAILSL
jgi:cyclase